MTGPLQSIAQSLHANFQEPYLYLPAIVIGSGVAGLITRWIFTRLIMQLAGKTHGQLDDKLVAILRGPITWTVVLLGIGYALSISPLSALITTFSIRILKTIGFLIWTTASLRLVAVFIDLLESQRERYAFVQPQTKPLMSMLSKALVIFLGLYFLSLVWNINVTAWLASAGILGIAVGFAAKDTLANFFSGIFIIADGPYKLGDYIVLESSNLRGRVTSIGIRSTRILTRDDVEVIVPNAIIGNSTVVNESGGPYEKFRVRLDFGVAYGSDIDKVQEIVLSEAEKDTLVVAHPEPRTRFRALGNSSLDFQLLFWVETPELRGMAIHSLLSRIYKAFNEQGIEIPFPQRVVHMRNGL